MVSAISGTREFLRSKTKLGFVAASLCLLGTSLGFSSPAKASVYDPAYAQPPYICTTGTGCCSASMIQTLINEMFTGTGLYASANNGLQPQYYIQSLWPKIETALKKVSDEVRNSNLIKIGARGALMDAQTFNLTITSLGKSSSESLITQTPSEQICRFGTLSASLARSGERSRVAQLGLASQMMHRELMRNGMASATEKGVGSKLGRTSDKKSRVDQYLKVFCDPSDANGSMGGLGPTGCVTTDLNRNTDIDITRTFYKPLTLNIGFTSMTGTPSADEQNIFALSNNLFAHDLPLNFSKSDFEGLSTDSADASDGVQERIMDYRALIAKRTVAQNSFAALAAMKARGSGESDANMKKLVEYLGLPTTDLDAFVGTQGSYYSQMEVLTRKLYQSPLFYANLMDSPANVARQQAAMEGIGLMQDRDTYESLRRSEMVLSTLLEIYVSQDQDKNRDKGRK